MAHPTYVAIDPLALLLPSSVYAKIIELLHPHVPLIEALPKALAVASAEERVAIVARANALGEVCHAVAKAAQVR